MATIDLGKIKLVWRGTYNNGTAYTVDDVVQYTDSGLVSSYICTTNSTGNAPSSSGTAHGSWAYLAKGGSTYTSTLTTQGDILYRDGSGEARLAKGTAGQALKINSGATAPEWGTIDDTFGSKLLHITKGQQTLSTTGSWTKIDLDTVKTNEISGASLSSGVVSLPAGTYLSMSSIGFYRTNDFNAKIRNTTDGADLLLGTGGHTWSSPNDASSPSSHINGKFTLSGTKNIEVQYYISTSSGQSTFQSGHPNQLLIWKTA